MDSACIPVIQSIVSAAALRDVIAKQYAIEPSDCRLLHHDRNDTYALDTPAGSWIARVYGAKWRTASDVRYELELLQHLSRKGVRVAEPLATRAGDLSCPLKAPEGERQLAIFSCLGGKPLEWTRTESVLAGQLAARIHSASDDFQSAHVRARLDLDYLLDASLENTRPFMAHRPADWRALQHIVDKLRAAAEAAISDGLEAGICHGDFNSSNIHIEANQTLSIFDFDFCGPGWRVYDFVDVHRKSKEKKRPEIWDEFIRGYRSLRTLGRCDLDSVPLFCAIGHVRGLGHHAWGAAYQGWQRMSDWYIDWELAALQEWEQSPTPSGRRVVVVPAS
jgi:Ser/Thr protein kinase RdoA (MazF antagonist)